MRVSFEDGCALCGSTWGNVTAEVDGERRFFCCAVCVVQFRAVVERVRGATGWSAIDVLEIEGGRAGRLVTASLGPDRRRFSVVFNAEGLVRRFETVAG